MTVTGLVSASSADFGIYPARFSFTSLSNSFSSLRTASPAAGEETPVERLEVIRKRFQSRGFSSGVVELLMVSV
jgi:hypothetical protein